MGAVWAVRPEGEVGTRDWAARTGTWERDQCARVYYMLHKNPEQYGVRERYWFSDGAPNMGAFRRELRKCKITDFLNPRIEEDWFGFKRYGF